MDSDKRRRAPSGEVQVHFSNANPPRSSPDLAPVLARGISPLRWDVGVGTRDKSGY